MAVAIVTGASRGLGRALALALAERGWEVVAGGRDADALGGLAEKRPRIHPVVGDVTDAWHRTALLTRAWDLGGLDLVVNNAGVLGGEGLASVAELSLEELRRAFEVNVIAPLGLAQEALPMLRATGGALVNISSDAAVEAYPSWGGYGSTKAALDLWSAVLAQEEESVRVWWVDPGEMRTAMYAAADAAAAAEAPLPEGEAVPGLLALLAERPPSGRYLAAALAGPGDPAPGAGEAAAGTAAGAAEREVAR